MKNLPETALFRYEIGCTLRNGLPYRFIPLLPAGIFLAAWTWRVASPFAAVVWLVFLGLEPRLNNIFYGSPRELEALSLLPADWRRIVLVKNLSTLLVVVAATALLSVIMLYFSPGQADRWRVADAAVYLATVVFPMLILGNEASTRNPRRDAGIFSGGLYEAFWISLTLLFISAPYFLITELIEAGWLCIPYAAGGAIAWYLRSIPATAAHIMNRSDDIWLKTATSSNY